MRGDKWVGGRVVMTAWMSVIGISDRGLEGLAAERITLIKNADVLIGGERHLSKSANQAEVQIDWSDGMDRAFDQIEALKGKQIVVLASGDPLHFGIGAKLVKRFGANSIDFLPSPGSFSLAAARMGWSIPDVKCLTVHGRPLETISLHLVPNATMLLLSWDGRTPKALAELLVSKGFGDSQITVLEHMEGEQENRIDGTASTWSLDATADLNTIALQCIAGPDAIYWPRLAGLPETAYIHDGKITKREVRAATLAALSPLPGETLWDVGAGSGAVGIEWMRSDTSLKSIAFEVDETKHTVIETNAKNLGVPGLKLIDGDFMETQLTMAKNPDAIFVGGGVSKLEILETCWHRLKIGGRLVANGVTVEAHRSLMEFQSCHGGEMVRISVARSGSVGPMTAMRPLMDVLQLKALKS